MTKETLNVREAASYLNLAPQSLNNRRCRCLPPAYCKIGSRIVYLRSDLDAFLQANRVNPQGRQEAR